VLVAPRSSRERIGPVVGERIKLSVKAPPVEGKANQAVIALLARALGVRRGAVSIVAGARGKRKTVRVAGVSQEAVLRLLDDAG
jgi:uncharacterized protein (TIGR00251 family)